MVCLTTVSLQIKLIVQIAFWNLWAGFSLSHTSRLAFQASPSSLWHYQCRSIISWADTQRGKGTNQTCSKRASTYCESKPFSYVQHRGCWLVVNISFHHTLDILRMVPHQRTSHFWRPSWFVSVFLYMYCISFSRFWPSLWLLCFTVAQRHASSLWRRSPWSRESHRLVCTGKPYVDCIPGEFFSSSFWNET